MTAAQIGGRVARQFAVWLPLMVVAACAEPSKSGAPASIGTAQTANPITDVGDDLGKLRAAIAQYQNVDVATQAQWAPITGCMSDPTLGGMGFHYARSDFLDGVLNPTQPKALLYEPESNGRLRLVAVEFVVPYTIAPRDGTPPRLFGQDFLQNDGFQLWMLHAWVFKNNPAGMFASWNPTVGCGAVPMSARMSHGH